VSPDDWRAAWERERDARLDAEARLSGLRSAMGAVVIAVVVVAALTGCLSATNEASRAVARWEVSDGE
jgi:anti-sigma-K factor RskA